MFVLYCEIRHALGISPYTISFHFWLLRTFQETIMYIEVWFRESVYVQICSTSLASILNITYSKQSFIKASKQGLLFPFGSKFLCTFLGCSYI